MRKFVFMTAFVMAAILLGSFSFNRSAAQATVVDPQVAFFNHAWTPVKPGLDSPPHTCFYLPAPGDDDPDCDSGVEGGDLGFYSYPYTTGVYCRAWNSSGGEVWGEIVGLTSGTGVGLRLKIWAERSDGSWYVPGYVVFHHLTSLNSAYNEVGEEIPCHDNAYIGYTYDQGDDSHVHNELDPTNQLWWNEDAYEDPYSNFGSSEWTFTIQ